MDDCQFCAIVAGELPARIVLAGAAAVAFAPLRPANPGHLLVVPRRHSADIWDVPPEDAHHLTDAVLRLSHAAREALAPDGLNVITSAGEAATQTVFHLHVHLVPRWHGDGFGDIWPKEPRVGAEEEAAAIDRIGAAAVLSAPGP
ncbi:hypothetical protein GCM10010182_52940 [Actinomadura cremea]|nr:hypothetical protein GCM10010182_52940 [Actinomadura cremea]